jgi:hypothetical protein
MAANSFVIACFLFSLAPVAQAQTPQLFLPDGNGAWLVQVVTRGGLTGAGQGDFAVTSEGKSVCNRPEQRCLRDFKAAEFHRLVEMIQAGKLPIPLVSLCSDCITRIITISRRDATGIVHTYTAMWDETTKGRLPQEVIRIYDALFALMK